MAKPGDMKFDGDLRERIKSFWNSWWNSGDPGQNKPFKFLLIVSAVLLLIAFAPILIWALPLFLGVALASMLVRGSGGFPQGILSFGKSRGRVYAEQEIGVRFKDVAGIDEAKEELIEIVEFLKTPEKFTSLGGKIPKGVLLVGAPGTGKTLLARAVAGESGVPFFSITGSDFVEMFVGVGAARVRDLFEQAKSNAPCIVFIDELDALGKARGISPVAGHDEREQTLNQLLSEMDGFDVNKGIIVMAATNRPEILDPALLRPGRFDRHVAIDLPDIRGREKILEIHTGTVKLGPDVNLGNLAAMTPGFAGADLANLVNEAALLAARRNRKEVGASEFEDAIDRIVGGLEKKNRVMSRREKSMVAYHEAGHAVVALNVPRADPVSKITIIPRGIGLGHTRQLPTEDRYIMTREELWDRLCVLLGGRVAEELALGEVSTGAANDLQQATDMVRSMITRYGMSERLGLATYGREGPPLVPGERHGRNQEYSEETAKSIDLEISQTLANAHRRVKQVLSKEREHLEIVAQALLEKETLTGEELKTLLEKGTRKAA
ncbi:MAG: ATP-dependent zinc metalloprotease FtsH [Syntrophobacteraceae bacterium]